MAEKFALDKPARPRRAVTVTVSLSSMAGSVVLLCAGFVLVFTLGILLGRGYSPEEDLPELGKVMPKTAPTAPPLVIAATGPGETAESGIPANPSQSPDRNSRVINQADLDYPDNLKLGSSAGSSREKPKQQEKRPLEGKPLERSSQNKPREKQQNTAPMRQAQSQGQTVQTRQSATAAKNADTQRYHYQYQAAAYKDQASCDRFVARLNAAGITARTVKTVEKGSAWYRAFVDFTGRPDDTDALKERLKPFGISKVIMKSKTPVK